MRALLILTACATAIVPLIRALMASGSDRARAVETWLFFQIATAILLIFAALLRAKERRAWPRREGRIISAKQTGSYGAGDLAIVMEISHSDDQGHKHTIFTKARVPAKEAGRYMTGATITVAVNPKRPWQGVAVE